MTGRPERAATLAGGRRGPGLIGLVTALWLVTVVALGASLLASGDGRGARDPQFDPIDVQPVLQRVWIDIAKATRDGDGHRACALMTVSYRRTRTPSVGLTCQQAVITAAARGVYERSAWTTAQPSFSGYVIGGDRATMRVGVVSANGPVAQEVRFRYVDGHWLLDEQRDVPSIVPDPATSRWPLGATADRCGGELRA